MTSVRNQIISLSVGLVFSVAADCEYLVYNGDITITPTNAALYHISVDPSIKRGHEWIIKIATPTILRHQDTEYYRKGFFFLDQKVDCVGLVKHTSDGTGPQNSSPESFIDFKVINGRCLFEILARDDDVHRLKLNVYYHPIYGSEDEEPEGVLTPNVDFQFEFPFDKWVGYLNQKIASEVSHRTKDSKIIVGFLVIPSAMFLVVVLLIILKCVHFKG